MNLNGRFSFFDNRRKDLYLPDRAVVVLNPEGEVVTTYPASKFDTTIKRISEQIYLRGAE